MQSGPSNAPGAARAIVTGGIAAGILDILFAFIFYGLRGASPVRILQLIAGKKAASGKAKK